MINLDKYEPLLRQLLKDIPNRNEQGYFWDSTALSLALNLSQIIFCKYCIATKQLYFLWRLLVKLEPESSFYRLTTDDPPLMFPATAWIKNEDETLAFARIYLGDGTVFLSTGHNACIIWNDIISFIKRDRRTGGALPSRGILYYYRYPRRIYLNSEKGLLPPSLPDIEQDFDDYVYEQYIVPYAAVILGMKEITNQRDQKTFQRFVTDILKVPGNFANFVFDFEFTGIKVRPGRPKSQDIEE